MLKLMLESVNGLLDEASLAKTMKARLTFITCAQSVLGKCIESINVQVLEPISEEEYRKTPPNPFPKKKKLETPEYEIRVDAKKLVKIVGADGSEAPHDLPMEIDGQVTTYGQAIGKSFNQGRFL